MLHAVLLPAGRFQHRGRHRFLDINESFTARVGVFNLFDKKYSWWSDVRGLAFTSTVTDAYTQPGRNFGLSLTARL
jgi:hemoglobin/transferrin/lactoferrin receptor protein